MYERLEECPLCKNGTFTNYMICTDHAVSQESFAIVQCNKCQLKFTNPRPSDKNLGKYYQSENYISHTNRSNSLINSMYKVARIFTIKRKISLINHYTNSKSNLLDFGCGTGTFVKAAHKSGWSAGGVEPNDKARALAESNTGLQIYGNIESISLKNHFEIITMWHVLEHVPNLNQTLKKAKSLLTSRGRLIVAVPNCDSLDAKIYKEYWAAYDVPRHLYHFTPITFKKLLAQHNLKLTDTKPMKLDAFYVSILSQKYLSRNNKNNYANIYKKAIKNAYRSNHWAKLNNNNFSSLIYVIRK